MSVSAAAPDRRVSKVSKSPIQAASLTTAWVDRLSHVLFEDRAKKVKAEAEGEAKEAAASVPPRVGGLFKRLSESTSGKGREGSSSIADRAFLFSFFSFFFWNEEVERRFGTFYFQTSRRSK